MGFTMLHGEKIKDEELLWGLQFQDFSGFVSSEINSILYPHSLRFQEDIMFSIFKKSPKFTSYKSENSFFLACYVLLGVFSNLFPLGVGWGKFDEKL